MSRSCPSGVYRSGIPSRFRMGPNVISYSCRRTNWVLDQERPGRTYMNGHSNTVSRRVRGVSSTASTRRTRKRSLLVGHRQRGVKGTRVHFSARCPVTCIHPNIFWMPGSRTGGTKILCGFLFFRVRNPKRNPPPHHIGVGAL